MIINPDTYCDIFLKYKNITEIKTAIRELRKEMKILKSLLEQPDFEDNFVIHPTKADEINLTRLCLKKAIQRLKDAGGKYNQPFAEFRAEKFDNSIQYISKIIFSIGDCFNGYETSIYTFDEYNVYVDKKSQFTEMDLDKIYFAETALNSSVMRISKSDFLNGLLNLHIGEWNDKYSTYSMGIQVSGGVLWGLQIEFSNDCETFKSYGDSTYPYNFGEFKQLLGIKYEEYKEKENF